MEIPEKFKKPVMDGIHAGQLLIYPGGKSSSLENKYQQQGVIFDDLANVIEENPELISKTVGTLVHAGDGKYAAMWAALASHGVFLYIPRGVKVTEPLHSLFCNQGNDIAAFSHNIVWLEDEAEVTFVQEYASDMEQFSTQFHAGILEVHVGQRLPKMVELQSWGEDVWNVMHEKVVVQTDGSLTWIFGSLGSRLTKSFSSVDLLGRGAQQKYPVFILQIKISISIWIQNKTTKRRIPPVICFIKAQLPVKPDRFGRGTSMLLQEQMVRMDIRRIVI